MALAARAIGSRDPDPLFRNPDWLAERFLGLEERAQLPRYLGVLAAGGDCGEAMKDARMRALVRPFTMRTKFIDEHLLKAIAAGAIQVVNLGAGLDTRAYRFEHALRHAKVFELDYAPTQAYKRRRVAEVLGPSPSNLVYAPIDFTREKLGDVLRSVGYEADRKTFFIWEGVTMYISEDAVLEVLRSIASNAPSGSAVTFDYFPRSRLDKVPMISEAERVTQNELKDLGEPWIFGIPDGTAAQFVKDAGLDLVDNLAWMSLESVQRYFTGSDGRRAADPPSAFPTPPLGQYYFAVAVVPDGPSSDSRS
jgi:methyltransferase (TIGR00027 family)